MKFRIQLKDPDGFEIGVQHAQATPSTEAENAIWKSLSKWVSFGELITIEFDTDAKTARVCEVGGVGGGK